MPPTPTLRHRLPVLAGLLIVTLALRPQIIGIGPLVPAIRSDLGISHGVAGLLGTIPVLCMGLFAPFGPTVARRLGPRRAIAACVAAIAAFVEWLIKSVVYTVAWIITHAPQILALPFTEAIALIRWLLYQVQKGIWEIYDNLRFGLVLGGYLFPEPEDLAKTPWGMAFINTAFAQSTGGAAPVFMSYPRKQEAHGLLGTTEHHLIYPGTLQERPFAEPAPVPFHGQDPEAFISRNWPYNPAIEKLFACTGPYGNNDMFTHFVDSGTWTTAQLGSAMWFSARLITKRIRDLPNMNLDGDRGYGWKTWRADDPKNIETNNPVTVQYIDP